MLDKHYVIARRCPCRSARDAACCPKALTEVSLIALALCVISPRSTNAGTVAVIAATAAVAAVAVLVRRCCRRCRRRCCCCCILLALLGNLQQRAHFGVALSRRPRRNWSTRWGTKPSAGAEQGATSLAATKSTAVTFFVNCAKA